MHCDKFHKTYAPQVYIMLLWMQIIITGFIIIKHQHRQ